MWEVTGFSTSAMVVAMLCAGPGKQPEGARCCPQQRSASTRVGLPGLLSGWTPAQVSLTAPHPHGAGLVVRWAEAMTPPCSSPLFPKGGIQPSSAILSLMLPVNYEVKHQEHPGHYSGLEVGGMPVVGKVLEQWGQESTFSLVWLSRHELPFWR